MPRLKDSLQILGADANNLRDVDVDFPFGSLTVVTGVSGSGKSSLLAQTIGAEGARRNAVFLGLSQPDLEDEDPRAFISAMPPTALVGQRGFRPSIRTTVASATGVLALLRRLFILESTVWSDAAKAPAPPPSPIVYARWLTRHYRGEVEILAAPVRMQKTDGAAAVKRLAAHDVETLRLYSETDPVRLRDTGREVRVDAFKPLNPNTAHSIEASFGLLKVSGTESEGALLTRLEAAFAASNGAVVVTLNASDDPALASPFGPRLDSLRNWVHPEDRLTFLAPSRHLLSFNAPSQIDSGACPNCAGTGVARRVDLDALISHPERSMAAGAFALWTAKNYRYLNIQHETIAGLHGIKEFDLHAAWKDLPASARELVLQGSAGEAIQDRDEKGRKIGAPRPFRGFVPVLLEKAAGAGRGAQYLAGIVDSGRCPVCDGARWSPQALALRVAGLNIAELLALSFEALADLWRAESTFADLRTVEGRRLIAALRKRAQDVVQVGMPYLTADRGMLDVSDGESRRLRIARVLAPDQAGFCLLLDEPGRGLHEADLGRLGAALGQLRGRHTVVLNEHRQSLWPVADRLLEFGPGAGPAGGAIVRDGPPPIPSAETQEVRLRLPPPDDSKAWLRINGIRHHNIRDADVTVPAGRLTTICGVSGSGKSSFVKGVLIPALTKTTGSHGVWGAITGESLLGEFVLLDQSVPPPNRRSLVATLSGVFDPLRKAFAASEQARREGLGPSDFGLNAGHGRCLVCEGVGSVETDGRAGRCPACGGARYGPSVQAVRVAGMNISEVLDTAVDSLPEDIRNLARSGDLMAVMEDLGIGHIALGRRIDTLSGGELQRLRLAVRLASSHDRATFILDEPAAGLHERDVLTLIKALDRVLDGGRNTIIVVEHDLEVIRASDWLVEFGPGSGPQGGDVVFQGVASEMRRRKTATALALAGRLEPITGSARQTAGRAGKADLLHGEDRAARTLAALRTIVTGDVAAADDFDPIEEAALGPPTMVLSEKLWAGRTPGEAAGLDTEVAKVLLDLHQADRDAALPSLLDAWAADPDAVLQIHPFLAEMRAWGGRVPRSLIRNRLKHLRAEGLALSDPATDDLDTGEDVRRARASGSRFAPGGDLAADRSAAVADALVIGGGYVELCGEDGKVKAVAGTRLVSFEDGIVGPQAPTPRDFSRHDVSGRCPACRGSRLAPRLKDDLLIARPDLPPSAEGFLTHEAEQILKGVRRATLVPYLKKLASEGLWNADRPFQALEDGDRTLLLHGDWRRPGFGTFLKSPNSNPAEVSSWLRWNGLYREALDQADRSSDKTWLDQLHSRRLVACRTCAGSGLRGFAELLPAGNLTFAAWSLSAPEQQVAALRHCDASNSARAGAGLRRIFLCLDNPVGKPLHPETVARRMVDAFTTLTPVEPAPLETD